MRSVKVVFRRGPLDSNAALIVSVYLVQRREFVFWYFEEQW